MNTDWKTGRIGDLCELRQEQRYPVKDEQTPYLSLEHVETGAFSAKRFGTAGEMLSSQNRFSAGDVLYGKLRPYLDKAVLADCEGACTTELLVLKPNPNVDSLYLLAALHTQDFIQHAIQTTHGVNHPRTSWAAIREFELLIAPPSEQRRIAAVLGKLQRAVELEAAQERAARELKQAVMRQLFTRGLRGESLRDSPIGPLPESWDVAPLGSRARIGNGSTPKRTNAAYWTNGNIPWLTSGKVHEGVISAADEFVTTVAHDECHLPNVPAGSVLVAITGQGKTLGNSALVTFDTCISQHLAYVTITDPDTHAEFVWRYLQSRYANLQEIGRGGGSTKAALTCQFLKDYLIPFPPLVEQKEIAAILAAISSKIALHATRRRARQDIFRSTLRALMTARLRMPEDSDHIADAGKMMPAASLS